MKKILLGLFVLISCFVLLFIGVKTRAVSAPTMVEGASIRATGEHQGLKFSATVDSLGGITEHGFYVALGEHTQSEMATAASADATGVGGKKLKKVEVTGEDTTFHAVIYNIPEASYGQVITAIAYVSDGSTKTFSSEVMTRNIADIARGLYNTTSTYDEDNNQVYTVANACRIKVIHSNSTINYYDAFSRFSFAAGDTIELAKGTYSEALTIGVDNITLIGAAENVEINNSGVRTDGRDESELTKKITLSDDVDNFSVNGVKFKGTNAMELVGSHNHITVKYCNLQFTGNYGIKDTAAPEEEYTDVTNDNIVYTNNYSYGKSIVYTRDFYLQGYTGNFKFIDNYCANGLVTINSDGYDYVLKINRIKYGANINIKDNTFNHLGANYIIDIGSDMSTSDRIEATINIENNAFAPSYTTMLGGNGIRITYIGTNSNIGIIKNYAFRVSSYYNTILLSSAGSPSSSYAQNPVINICYNKLYAESSESDLSTNKPTDRTELDKRKINIALGFAKTQSNFNYSKNYYSGPESSNSAYTSNSVAEYTTGNYTAKTLNGSKSTLDNTNTAISSYNSEMEEFTNNLTSYLSEMGELDGSINAFYGGSDSLDITSYIPSFDSADADLYEIQDGKLVVLINNLISSKQTLLNDKGIEYSSVSLKP